jgi:2-polyprenyl-3-methyl-5-hydroxy-6-metoxy-1,4-benzoquinol methylase
MAGKHTSNPLNLPPHEHYFGMVRHEVIASLRSYDTQAKRIIELGCGGGDTGAELKKALSADHYFGIDVNAQAIERARTKLDRAEVINIERNSPEMVGLREGEFDLLLALDVLEHLYNPWDVLADWVTVVRPGGRVVLSIPNMQNVDVIAQLAQGHWTYANSGLLDVTHIRFFTKESAAELATGAGLTIRAIDAVLDPRVDYSKTQPTGNTFSVDKITFNNLTGPEVMQLAVWQHIVIADVPA